MRKIFVFFLLGLCVCLVGGCCNGNGTTPDEPDTPEPPANNVTYLTSDIGHVEIYVTSQPFKEVDDYIWVEPGTGEYSSSGYYLSTMGIAIPYGTRWSDGSVTLSLYPFEGVTYTRYESYDDFIEFNDTSFVSSVYEANGTEPDYWNAGTAPNGRTESDYTYDSEREQYVYNSGNSNTNTQQVAEQTQSTSPPALSDEDSDDEDVNGNVNENDGRNLDTNR
jgi:hypothetical protein